MVGVDRSGMSQAIPFSRMTFVTGVWTEVAAVNQWSKNKAAAAETAILRIQAPHPLKGAPYEGCPVKSIDICWSNGTADLVSLTPAVWMLSAPWVGMASEAPAVLGFTYDSDHDTAAKRVIQGNHKMTLTLDPPVWVDDGELLCVELTIVSPAMAVYRQKDARVYYTLCI